MDALMLTIGGILGATAGYFIGGDVMAYAFTLVGALIAELVYILIRENVSR